MPARIVLFDLGNVVVDWDPLKLYTARFADAEKARWFCDTVCTMAWHTQHDAGARFDDTIPPLAEAFPDYAEDIEAWRDQWLEMFHGYVPGVPAIIAELEEARVPLFGLSNLPAQVAEITFTAFAMIKVLHDVVVSGREGVIKPDPKIYEIALARMGRPAPGDVFFIDDRPENIEAAERLGFIGHVFTGAGALRGPSWPERSRKS
ncbi:MAG: HAD family phosphatase [Pseudomonadota bacterium]